MKRIVTLQDISCLGRCSVTVALPVISAMGVECVALPTAVLSTHTMFPDFTCLDLTDQIAPIARHWKAQSIHFDAIYTGYLASPDQCDRVIEFFQDFRTPDGLIFVDPAMADGGKLYAALGPGFPRPAQLIYKGHRCGTIGDIVRLHTVFLQVFDGLFDSFAYNFL